MCCILLSELDTNIESVHKEHRKAQKELDEAKKEERTQQDKLDEEAKELEKMSNKQSMLTKKVGFFPPHTDISLLNSPSPPLFNIRVMVIVHWLGGNIISTALCWIV